MLKVDQYSTIRTAHRVYGKKVKQIARETGHSKNTVKKVLRGEYSGYKPRVEQPYLVLGPFTLLSSSGSCRNLAQAPENIEQLIRTPTMRALLSAHQARVNELVESFQKSQEIEL